MSRRVVSPRHTIGEYVEHYNEERPHQGIGKEAPILIQDEPAPAVCVKRRKRLGGLAIVILSAPQFPKVVPSVAFELSDAVLITLLSTTRANVIGVFIIVMKYFFTRDDVKPKS